MPVIFPPYILRPRSKAVLTPSLEVPPELRIPPARHQNFVPGARCKNCREKAMVHASVHSLAPPSFDGSGRCEPCVASFIKSALQEASLGLCLAIPGLILAILGVILAIFGLRSAALALILAILALILAILALIFPILGLMLALLGLILALLGLILAILGLVRYCRHGKRSQASIIAVLGLFLAQLRRHGKRSQASIIAKGIDTHTCIYGGGYPEEDAPLAYYGIF